MKNLAILTLIFTMFLGIAVNTSKAADKKPLKGYVASLNALVIGQDGKITKDEAKKLAEAGNAIVFVSGKKVYFVYNDDSSFGGKKLANYANAKVVGIVGKVKTVKGINYIIAEIIEEM